MTMEMLMEMEMTMEMEMEVHHSPIWAKSSASSTHLPSW